MSRTLTSLAEMFHSALLGSGGEKSGHDNGEDHGQPDDVGGNDGNHHEGSRTGLESALGVSHVLQRWCREQPVWFIPPTPPAAKILPSLVRRSSAKPDGSRRCTHHGSNWGRPDQSRERNPGGARVYCRAFRPPGVGLGGYGHPRSARWPSALRRYRI
jgi:hypothetical protein